MKIRLSEKYFRVRLTIILTSCFFVFIVSMTILGTSELGLEKIELNKGQGTLLSIRESYDTIDRLHRPTKYEPCFDIMLEDNKPFIRLSKDYEKYREIFKNLKIQNNEVVYFYHDRRYREYKVYNPSELVIGGFKITDFDSEHRNDKLYYSLMVLFDILVFFVLVVALVTYRENQVHVDKSLIAEKQYWKLAGKWWDE